MIWIIIPAYNEARNVPQIVRGVAQVLGSRQYRITIVNDGSTDDTLCVVQELSYDFPLTVINHPTNRGVAEAFRTGVTAVAQRAAPDDVVVIMEGDTTSNAAQLLQLTARIDSGADVVIASRYQPGGAYQRFPFKRLLLSRGANFVLRLLLPIPGVRDYSIFYRAYRAQCLKQALAHYGENFITVQSFFANIEMLLHLRPWVKRIEEIPLVYDYSKKQGKSSMKVGKNLRSYISFIIRHAFRSKSD